MDEIKPKYTSKEDKPGDFINNLKGGRRRKTKQKVETSENLIKKDFFTRARLFTGVKREITIDDSFALPAVELAVEQLGYGELGEKIGAGGEYSVRRLGENKVARIAEPDNIKLVINYINWSEVNLSFLRENIPDCIPKPEIVLAKLDDDTGCCVVIENKVRGKGLSQLEDIELQIIRVPLLSILQTNQKLYKEQGLSLDLSAVEVAQRRKNILIGANPRYTENIFATTNETGDLDGGAMLIDLLVLPRKKNPNFPRRFRTSSLFYRLVVPTMLRNQQKLIKKIENISS